MNDPPQPRATSRAGQKRPMLRGLGTLACGYLAVVIAYLLWLQRLAPHADDGKDLSDRDAAMIIGFFAGAPALVCGFLVSVVVLAVAVRRWALSIGKASGVAVLTGLVAATLTFGWLYLNPL